MEMGPCTQQWNFLYVTEAAELLVKLLLGKAPAGVYNVAGEDTRRCGIYRRAAPALRQSGKLSFRRQAAQCGGHGIADAGIDEIKGSSGLYPADSFFGGDPPDGTGEKRRNLDETLYCLRCSFMGDAASYAGQYAGFCPAYAG